MTMIIQAITRVENATERLNTNIASTSRLSSAETVFSFEACKGKLVDLFKREEETYHENEASTDKTETGE